MGRVEAPLFDEAVHQLQLAADTDDPRIQEAARAQFAKARTFTVEAVNSAAISDALRDGSAVMKIRAMLAMDGAVPSPTRSVETRVIEVRRNGSCPCGSGRKAKRCCL